MSYQLVLQWWQPNLPSFDELLAIEEALIEVIGQGGDVDGHDVGASECNIFIETENPEACFEKVRARFDTAPWFADLYVGYRRMDSDVFTPVWPESMPSFSVS
ncbi:MULTISPECIES: hypothetical protein [Luteibacter]|uniref:hypothetical protein n=1 Tax=Luteibacter TaxID=242605 RepID=UPI0005635F91|nr:MULTISPECIES: hypothetical protein [unclassified Luteibacter]MDR6644057.1 hypothetical protein [Luteibacter sp. 1214]